MKPKILFVVTTPLTANVFLLKHVQRLSNEYCIYICLNTSLHELLPELKSNVKVIHINIQRKISFYYDLISLIHLFIVCKRINPQVVHSITPKSGLLGMLAALIAGVPFRWHTFTGQVWVTRKSISRLFFKFIDKCIVFFSTQVFCDSKSQQQFLVKEHIVLPNKISVLGYGSISGVDIDRFYLNHEVRSVTRFQLARKIDSCIFLYVGRLSRDKGIFELFQAFSLLTKRIEGVELWIVGPDEEKLQSDLLEIALLNDIFIRWIGPTNVPEKYMMSADVFIFPSFREGFGSVIIEAASCCIPSIAYRIDGVVDAIEDGVTGELIDLHDVKALSESMYSFVDNPMKRTEMGKNARERVVKYYQSEEITKAWLEQYKKIYKL